ncbi:MAG: leucine--tRNA ligase [Candidatus Wallbacteria bacterium]|nr:leucine--tRNA ligase [Candidatus Wallbacteria bacterium]
MADRERFNPSAYEKKWRERWEQNRDHYCDTTKTDKKYYCLDMFPYPSGLGLHVGHWRGYVLSDVLSRYKKIQGYNVLHPMGWDAFGLPAENDAIKKKIHPRINVELNIANMKRQLREMGSMYDWTKEINTTDPDYYKWTQWIFVQMFKQGLAYRKMVPINWCPSCKTGLANEEVVNGCCDRCEAEVERKDMMQWMLRITAYADRLIADLDKVDWPEKVKLLQRNWIGRSEGAEVKFKLISSRTGKETDLQIFTTRPDTLFGATYMVLAPEHPLVAEITTDENKNAIEKYQDAARKKSDLQRISLDKDKTGVFTGSFAVNPMNHEKIPVWISDYVMMSYGTGAIMAVPAHDGRDFEFATKFGLRIIEVIDSKLAKKDNSGKLLEAFCDVGKMINSGKYTGMNSDEGRKKIIAELEAAGLGRSQVNYKLRDWIFSRQRYWGEPIPIVLCGKCGEVAVPETELPLRLPEVEKYEPTGTGDSPLAAITEWVNVKCPCCGGAAKRETITMPQWAGSCWYFLRYLSPDYKDGIADPAIVNKWHPVDQYVGGIEHAVLHLLYARFYIKFLYDIKAIGFDEPFQRLFNQGMVCKVSDKSGRLEKMSKSRGNVVNPDDLVEKYGTDSIRLYELFIGPPDADSEWSDSGIIGIFRFLSKTWDLLVRLQEENAFAVEDGPEILKARHQLIFKATDRMESFKFNTTISAFMEFTNFINSSSEPVSRDTARDILILIAPFAPHFSCELWERIFGSGNPLHQKWPLYDRKYLVVDEIEIGVQVLGKLRGSIKIKLDCTEAEAVELARKDQAISKQIGDKVIKKVIFVKGKILNLIV